MSWQSETAVVYQYIAILYCVDSWDICGIQPNNIQSLRIYVAASH